MRALRHVRSVRHRVLPGVVVLAAVAALGGLAGAVVGSGGAPAPCDNTPQITDPSGDGHHSSSDVLSAWFSEAGGHLQVVIKVRSGTWVPEHDDADINGSGFAFLFGWGGKTRYVRASAPPPGGGSITYDYGTYTPAGGFAGAGATTGSVVYDYPGTVTIDVPGSVLSEPFVLTYDGITDGVPTWVDHAPGGESPTDPARGADYVVGSCDGPVTTTPTGTTTGTTTSTTGTTTQPVLRTSAVQLTAPVRITGGGRRTITGRVLPARGGVPVALTATGDGTVVTHLKTSNDGSFTVTTPINETTRFRAVAEGIGSQTVTVTVRSTVHVTVKRLRSGVTRVTGRFKPALPGRVLWLRTTSVRASASAHVSTGRFTFRLRHPVRGRYQAVYIPSGARAERSVSNIGVIK